MINDAHNQHEIIEALFRAFQTKDLEGCLACFAEDAILFDPHYRIPRMRGIGAIRRGLEWGLKAMQQPGFTVRQRWFGEQSGVVEVDTHHVLKRGYESRVRSGLRL